MGFILYFCSPEMGETVIKDMCLNIPHQRVHEHAKDLRPISVPSVHHICGRLCRHLPVHGGDDCEDACERNLQETKWVLPRPMVSL
jgi:hypothetical protein